MKKFLFRIIVPTNCMCFKFFLINSFLIVVKYTKQFSIFLHGFWTAVFYMAVYVYHSVFLLIELALELVNSIALSLSFRNQNLKQKQ